LCASCIETSAQLLGAKVAAVPVAPAGPVAPPPSTWNGPQPIWDAAIAALRGQSLPLVVAGPEGVGKRALLAALGRAAPPAKRVDFAAGSVARGSEPLLVENLESASAAARHELAGRAFVAIARASVEVAPLRVQHGEATVELPVAAFALPSGTPNAAVL